MGGPHAPRGPSGSLEWRGACRCAPGSAKKLISQNPPGIGWANQKTARPLTTRQADSARNGPIALAARMRPTPPPSHPKRRSWAMCEARGWAIRKNSILGVAVVTTLSISSHRIPAQDGDRRALAFGKLPLQCIEERHCHFLASGSSSINALGVAGRRLPQTCSSETLSWEAHIDPSTILPERNMEV